MRSPACFAVLTILLLGSGVARGADGDTRLVIGPRSTLVLNGSSNVAGWRCSGNTLHGAMSVAAPLAKINDVIDRIEDGNISRWMSNPGDGRFPQPELALSIPIATLRCSGGRPMERDMNEALNADRFGVIGFQFGGLRSGITHDIDRRSFHATIAGRLSLAGVTREISFKANAQRISRTRFHITADMPVRMTEFGITPPRALFGMIKAADELSVTLDLIAEVSP